MHPQYQSDTCRLTPCVNNTMAGGNVHVHMTSSKDDYGSMVSDCLPRHTLMSHIGPKKPRKHPNLGSRKECHQPSAACLPLPHIFA